MNTNPGDVLVDNPIRQLDIVDPAKLGKKPELNVDQLALLLYIKMSEKTDKQAKDLGGQARLLQEKAKFLHDTSEKFKSLIDKDGNIDISKDAELQKNLKIAREELGIKIPDQTKFDSYQRERVLESLGYQRDDWAKESAAKMKEVDAVNAKTQQLILLANKLMDKSAQTMRKLIDHIK